HNGVANVQYSHDIDGTSGDPASITIVGAEPTFFGTVASGGGTNAIAMTIRNNGGVNATSFVPSLATGTNWSIIGGGTCTGTIAPTPGGDCTVMVRFAPGSNGALSDTLQADYHTGLAAAPTSTRGLSGIGAAPAVLTLSGFPQVDFDRAAIGGGYNDETITITYAGGVPASSVAESFTTGTYFSIPGGWPGPGGTCPVGSISATCDITVRFSAGAPAGVKSDTITVDYNDGTGMTLVARDLTGNAQNPANVVFNDAPGPYDFGIVLEDGANEGAYIFRITNNGGIDASSFGESGLGGVFDFTGGLYPGNNGDCDGNLEFGTFCDIEVAFNPSAGGAASDTIQVDFDNGLISTNSTLGVQGTGYVEAMTLSLLNPATSPNNDTTPQIQIGGVITGLGVALYRESSCTNQVGSGTAAGATINITSSVLGTANYTFASRAEDDYGNTICSAATVSYNLDATPPADPSGWTISSPANGSRSNDASPIISATGIVGENGSTTEVWDNPTCTGGALASDTIAAGSATMTGTWYVAGGGDDGLKQYYGQITDAVGNQSNCVDLSLSYTYDTVVNPATGVTLTANLITNSSISPTFNWTNPGDTDIDHIEVGLCTLSGGCDDVVSYTNIAAVSTSHQFTGLTLSECTYYYPTVKMVDTSGNESTLAVDTSGFRVDATGPSVVGALTNRKGSANAQSPLFTWTAATDACSGIDHYEFAVGTTAGDTDVSGGWTDIGNVLTYQQTGLSMSVATNYFVTVRAVDVAGNAGTPTDSGAFRTDVVDLVGTSFQSGGTCVEQGSDNSGRILVVSVHVEYSGGTKDVTNVQWGDRNLTQGAEEGTVGGGGWGTRTEIFYLNDAGIQANTGGNAITVTHNGTLDSQLITCTWLEHVNQAAPISGSNSSYNGGTNINNISTTLAGTVDGLTYLASSWGDPAGGNTLSINSGTYTELDNQDFGGQGCGIQGYRQTTSTAVDNGGTDISGGSDRRPSIILINWQDWSGS
ncbi:MAG: choice-of-anchor D domain-containing protein, partial [Bdellovibrionales bacterium]|nr:choice-of-anchor D domain-containing protein [Bdellovibrionales bacterium]